VNGKGRSSLRSEVLPGRRNGWKSIMFLTFCSRNKEGKITYLLTPWSRVLLEKLTGSAASQEISILFRM
jgi:hypothetical protein